MADMGVNRIRARGSRLRMWECLLVIQFRRLLGEARGSPITVARRGTRVRICTSTVYLYRHREPMESVMYTHRGQARRGEPNYRWWLPHLIAWAETFVSCGIARRRRLLAIRLSDVELRGQCHSSFRPRPLMVVDRLSLQRQSVQLGTTAWRTPSDRPRRSVLSLTSAHRFRPLLGGPRLGSPVFSFRLADLLNDLRSRKTFPRLAPPAYLR
jgi:hypothetical protein